MKLKRVLSCFVLLLCLLSASAYADTAKGEANITPETTMRELRRNPSVKGSGFYTYSQDKDCPPGQALWELGTLEQYTNRYVAYGSAQGMNLVIENYNNGVQVTHQFYTDEQIVEVPSRKRTALFYFPAETENTKYVLVLPGSGANESAELEEGACTAWQLHEMGYTVFVLRYRIWTDASADAPMEDIGYAVKYITEHAEEFGVQTEDYAVVGYSAGGHIAGLFGTDAVGYKNYDVPKPAALILAYPINNFTVVKPLYHVVMDIGTCQPRFYTMTLSDYVTDDYPATYHWHGKNDLTLLSMNMAAQSPTLEKALVAHNIVHKYVVYKDAPHVSGIGGGTDAENWMYDAVAFWEAQTAE